jgi:hypothetical protein
MEVLLSSTFNFMRLNEVKSSKILMNLLKSIWLQPDICLRQIACAATIALMSLVPAPVKQIPWWNR